ncbi:MAG: hypothetical protein FJ128_11740 [Deltaproteobacteria bacterium]|nr:hypothetical protein [Deltaproteobacteria bacterium]
MTTSIVIRRHDGFQSYLVLDDNPRELLRHWGFPEEFSMRRWLGSLDPMDAMEEWAEMLAEDLENYSIADDTQVLFVQERRFWEHLHLK